MLLSSFSDRSSQRNFSAGLGLGISGRAIGEDGACPVVCGSWTGDFAGFAGEFCAKAEVPTAVANNKTKAVFMDTLQNRINV